MPTLNWNKWSDAWSSVFPKNTMWASIRSGENDPETGEPLYRFEDKPNTDSVDPALADVIAAHRFVAPAVVDSADEGRNFDHCFCEWAGPDHGDHLQEKVNEFLSPPAEEEEEEEVKPRRRSRKPVEMDDKE